MSVIDQIEAQRKIAVVAINQILLRADEFGWEHPVLEELEDLKEELENAAVDAILDSDQLAKALVVLRQATDELKDAADNMTDLTKFMSEAAELLAKAKEIAAEVEKIVDGQVV